MLKKYLSLSLIILAGGCVADGATVKNTHSPNSGEAVLGYSAKHVRLVSVDGKPFPQTAQSTALTPGEHTVAATLNYKKSGYVPVLWVSKEAKSLCFVAEAQTRYTVFAKASSELSWSPAVRDSKGNAAKACSKP